MKNVNQKPATKRTYTKKAQTGVIGENLTESVVKTTKYLDLISKSAEQKNTQELEFRAEEAKQSVSMRVLETKKSLFEKRRELLTAQSAVPYNIEQEMKITSDIERLEKGLSFAENVLAERF